MDSINKFLSVPFVDCGRDMKGLDCWGLVRLAAHELFGIPWLPNHDDCSPDDKVGLTLRHDELSSSFRPVNYPQAGDIAGGYIGKKCIHVGICVEIGGRFRILHTRRRKGAQIVKLSLFALEYQQVKWWRYGDA